MGGVIWVFNQFASTPETNTGAGERYYYLGNIFQERNWKTYVFSAAYNHLFLNQPERKIFSKTVKFESGLQFIWLWVLKYKPSSGLQRLLNWFSFVFSLFVSSKRKLEKPNIIVVSSMSMWPILNAIWYRYWHPNVKVIFEIRDIWPLTPLQIGSTSPKNPVIIALFWLEKFAYKKADHLISVLPSADLRIAEVLGHDKFKYTWIPNAIHNFSLDSVNDELQESDKFTVMYAGAIGPANCLEVLTEAAAKLLDKPIEFVIVGDGPNKSALESLNISNVRFTGKVHKTEVHSILMKADLLFIAWHEIELYKYGVSANKYNDYMLLKKPILSVGKIAKDPVEMANCGLVVKNHDSNEVVDAFIQFMNMPKNELISMGNNGYNYVKKNGVYDVISEKYLNLMNSLSSN